MALLCGCAPALQHQPTGEQTPQAARCLAQLTAAEALRLAAQSASGATLNLAERAILAGPASQAMADLRAQLTSLHARAAAPTASAPDFAYLQAKCPPPMPVAPTAPYLYTHR